MRKERINIEKEKNNAYQYNQNFFFKNRKPVTRETPINERQKHRESNKT